MRGLFILVIHLLATLAKLIRPGGVRSVVAESLLLKHQLLILKRARKIAPKITPYMDHDGAANLIPKDHRENSSPQFLKSNGAILGSAVYTSRSRFLTPSASTSIKMSFAGCSRSTTDPTQEPTVRRG